MSDLGMSNAANSPVLAVKNLGARYAESNIPHGSISRCAGAKVVTLLGRNGAGKTTTLKSVMGVIGKRTGSISLLVEQNFRFASTVADRICIVEHGKIIDVFSNSELQTNMEKTAHRSRRASATTKATLSNFSKAYRR
jgi:branched-chain amino acid transport system ATP-binding protein